MNENIAPTKALLRLLRRLLKEQATRKPKNWDSLQREARQYGICLQSEKEDWDFPRVYYIEHNYCGRETDDRKRAENLLLEERKARNG